MEHVEKLIAWVLKSWHSLLVGPLGLDASAAWVISLIMLVVTIRGLLFPLAYRQYSSGRHLANLRPGLRRIKAEFEGKDEKKNPEIRKERLAKERELRKNSDYKTVDGCLPALIQLPLVLGLYQLLLRIARPAEGIGATHQGFGPLSSQDISSFLDAHLFSVPISSYPAMKPEMFSALGTTHNAVLTLALPLALCASIFTTANWAYTMKRNLQVVDHASVTARGMVKIMWPLGPIMLIFPILFGLFGPAPIAILVYWVCNNLWTAMQTYVIQRTLDKRVPYTEEFREHHEEQKTLYLERKQEKKAAQRNKKAKGRHRL